MFSLLTAGAIISASKSQLGLGVVRGLLIETRELDLFVSRSRWLESGRRSSCNCPSFGDHQFEYKGGCWHEMTGVDYRARGWNGGGGTRGGEYTERSVQLLVTRLFGEGSRTRLMSQCKRFTIM